MPKAMGFKRYTALTLAALLLLLSPMMHLHRAYAGERSTGFVPGVKTVAFGVAATAAVMFALSACSGPAKVMCSAGAAGVGASGAIGGAMGSMWTGVKCMATAMGTLARGALSAIGLAGGSTSVGVASVATRPSILVPLAILGAGLLAYYFLSYNRYGNPSGGMDPAYRYDRTAGQRYDNPYYATNLQSGGAAAVVNPYTGYGSGVGYRPTSFFDRFKMAVTGGTYAPPSLMASGYYGGIGNFFMGGPNAFTTRSFNYLGGFGTAVVSGPSGLGGTPFDINGVGDPARLLRVDSIGRGVTGVDVGTRLNREAMRPASAPDTTSVSSAPAAAGSTDFKKAQEDKVAAYNRMITAIKNAADGVHGDDVKKAIADYQSAETKVKELSGAK